MKTPESVAPLSGGYLFIPEAERLELPEDMVYLSDVPGMQVFDEAGAEIGAVSEVVDQGAGELLKVRVGTKEMLIPWNDHFVKSVDKAARRVNVDISTLRGLL
jgi:16S rRNA processing protein RimM